MTERSATDDLGARGWVQRTLDGFIETAGPLWCLKDGDEWRYGMHIEAKHLNRAGVAHGGVLLTLFDHAMSTIAWEKASRRICVTVQVSAHMHLAAKLHCFLEARGRVVRQTRDLMFLEGALSVDETDILTGQSLHKVIGK